MSDKSHVSMEQHQCPVCGRVHDTGVILLDKRLRQSMEMRTLTGWGLCPEHQAKFDEGFVALVEMTDDKQSFTGNVVFVRRTVLPHMLNVPVPDNTPVVHIQIGVIDKIKEMTNGGK